jgi:transcriptional regulator with GAF, ATPase, and Fis domain
MDLAAIEQVSLAVAEQRSLDVVLQKIVTGLAGQPHVALARVWLLDEEERELSLAASEGRSLDKKTRWSRKNGRFSRVKVGDRKIGHIGESGESILLTDLAEHSEWIADLDWAKRERIKSFGGHALKFRGEVLGVLGLFSRRALGAEEFSWLRLFAGHAAAAIAHARAFAEVEALRAKLELENAYLKEESHPAPELIGESEPFLAALKQLELVAGTEMPLLILGESGTGKELFAKTAHHQSSRRDRPLIKVNCAAIPRELFESEFFGHSKGAFTGAAKDRVGRFELADGGSLFLDEVGEIPLELQAKLLRVLQDGELERVGESRTRKVDVRIIAATNRDLKAESEQRGFRRDLYYRLGVFPVHVPPLRERDQDVLLLAERFITRAGKTVKLSSEDIDCLLRYEWPGNVRELQHVIDRALLLGQGNTLRLDLALGATKPVGAPAKKVRKKREILTLAELKALEKENITAALLETGHQVYGPRGAARLLQMKPTTLASRIKALGIEAG